jgi:hypothetical protein
MWDGDMKVLQMSAQIMQAQQITPAMTPTAMPAIIPSCPIVAIGLSNCASSVAWAS